MLIRLFVVMVLLTTLGPQARAQDPDPLVTDRPDQTESAQVVRAGRVQVEAGWTLDRVSQGAVRIHTHAAPGILVRVGVTPRFEARWGFSGWERSGVSGIPGTATVRGDMEVGFKSQIRSATAAGPAVAVLGAITLPTGSSGASSGRVDPSALLAVAHQLSELVTLSYNVGAGATTSSAGPPRQTAIDLLGSVSVGLALTSTVGAFVESFGSYGASTSRGNAGAVDGGLTILLRDNLQWDVSGGFGFGEAAEWFVGSGLSVRLPR